MPEYDDERHESWKRRLEESGGNVILAGLLALFLAVFAVSCGSDSGSPSASPTPIPSQTPSQADTPDESTGFSSIHFISAETGWVSGYLGNGIGGAILNTTDGGDSWQLQYSGARPISALYFISPLTGWALVAPHQGSQESHTLLQTLDGGDTWLEASELVSPSDLQFIEPQLARALVGRGADRELVETTDGGRTWATLATPSNLSSICFSDADHGWAATGDEVLHTTDGGRNWATAFVVPPDLTYASANRISCLGENVAWILLPDGVGLGHRTYALYRTVDAGINWEPVLAHQYQLGVPDRGPAPGSLRLIDQSTAYFTLYCGACGVENYSILATNDAGNSWTSPVAIPGLRSAVIAFHDADRGWAAGASYDSETGMAKAIIFTTADGGQTWTKQYP